MAVPTVQARLDEKETAEKKAEKLEKEAADLSKRLVDLKMNEIERMNEVRLPRQPHLTPARSAPRCLCRCITPNMMMLWA